VTGQRFLPRGVASLPDESTALDESVEPSPAEPSVAPELPAAFFDVTSGELTSVGMTLRLADAPIPGSVADGPREIVVTFAMPLPVAQIGMFVARALPVPQSMFHAELRAFGAEIPFDVGKITVLSADAGAATLELSAHVAFARADLPYPDQSVTLTAMVSVP
jgi:hypothetical protein